MSCQPNPDIYSFLIEQLSLNQSDLEALKKKRGFTEETIRRLKFRSIADNQDELFEKLKAKFSRGELISCGLVHEGKLVWNLWSKGLIVIPYLDSQGACYYLKSHKNGNFRDLSVVPYSTMLAESVESDSIVLCESEFKAAAMWQMGFKAVGLGGIATFTGKNIEKLKPFLEKVNKVYILFDTEIQDNQEFPNYKNHFHKMYAQHIWAYIQALRIHLVLDSRTNPKWDIKIATLPKEWCIEGKVDVDSAMAAGRTREDFLEVLRDALPADVYREELKIERKHKPWVNRQMEMAFTDNVIYVTNNCYWVKKKNSRKNEPEFIDKELSNFIIKLRNTIHKGTEVFREIVLISKYEDISPVFMLTSEEMSSFSSFRKKCLSQGDFLWKGTESEFGMVIEQLFLDNDTVPIHLLELAGRDETNLQWVFENMIIKDTGEILFASEDHLTFWDEDRGYRLVQLGTNLAPKLSKDPVDIEEVFDKFQTAWGMAGIMAFAYAISTLFSNVVFNQFRAFPFAMIYGEKESGKTSLSDAMVMLLGFTPHYTSLSLSRTSSVGIERALSYHCSLPCRFDEFRKEEKSIEDKSSFLRSAYNRQASLKGKRDTLGVREVRVNGSVVIIGEQKPSDQALLSRMIPVYLTPTRKTTKSYEAVQWLYRNADKLSYVAYSLLKNYGKNGAQLLKDVTDTREGLEVLHDIQSSFRVQYHFAIILAALALVLPTEKVKALVPQIQEKFHETVKDQTDMSILSRFFCDLLTMRSMGEKVTNYLTVEKEKPSEGIVYFPGLYSEWARFRQQHGGISKLADEATLIEYFTGQLYCIGNGIRKRVPASADHYVRCHKVSLAHPQVSGYLKELFEGVTYYNGVNSLSGNIFHGHD